MRANQPFRYKIHLFCDMTGKAWKVLCTDQRWSQYVEEYEESGKYHLACASILDPDGPWDWDHLR